MKGHLFFMFSVLIVLSSCTNDSNGSDANSSEKDSSSKSFSQKIENIDDKIGPISNALAEIQRELRKGEAANKNLSKVKLYIKDDFTLVYENAANGKEKMEIDIRKLNKNNIRLVTEDEGRGFPGVALGTTDYDQIIKRTKGDKTDQVSEIILVFDTRETVARIVPIFIQSIAIANGEYDKYYN